MDYSVAPRCRDYSREPARSRPARKDKDCRCAPAFRDAVSWSAWRQGRCAFQNGTALETARRTAAEAAAGSRLQRIARKSLGRAESPSHNRELSFGAPEVQFDAQRNSTAVSRLAEAKCSFSKRAVRIQNFLGWGVRRSWNHAPNSARNEAPIR